MDLIGPEKIFGLLIHIHVDYLWAKGFSKILLKSCSNLFQKLAKKRTQAKKISEYWTRIISLALMPKLDPNTCKARPRWVLPGNIYFWHDFTFWSVSPLKIDDFVLFVFLGIFLIFCGCLQGFSRYTKQYLYQTISLDKSYQKNILATARNLVLVLKPWKKSQNCSMGMPRL